MWLATKKEIAKYCKVSESKLDEWLKKYNDFPILIEKNGATWRTTTELLDEWFKKRINQNLFTNPKLFYFSKI